jgi:hypothetical protein
MDLAQRGSYKAKRRPSGRGGALVAENRVVIGDKDVGVRVWFVEEALSRSELY